MARLLACHLLTESTAVHRLLFLFFFLSGFSSLVFEVIWARMLQQVFGTTSFAISTLLTAFMAGLALGSYLGGKLASRLKDPLRVYGLLEGTIGLYALVVPLLLAALPSLYSLLFEQFIDNFWLFSLLRFGAVFAILLIPTTLMGATLPLVSQWIAARSARFQGKVGLLYGVNTLGACLGCLLAGFAILPTWGLNITNYGFALVNLVLAILVVWTARRLRQTAADDAPAASDSENRLALPAWAVRFILIIFGLTGAVAMSYQVLWTRAYIITLGSSTYSFTLVLTAVLVGIAIGSALLSLWVARIQRPLAWFSFLQFAVAITAALSFFTLNRVPFWFFSHLREAATMSAQIFLFQFALVALVVTVPSILQGMCFPLVIRAVTGRRDRSGNDVGKAYAYNTTGSIIGSFGAGFILLPALGLQQAITVVIATSTLAAIAAALGELLLRPRALRAVQFGAATAATVIIIALAPALDRAHLTSGIFRAQMARDVFSERSFARHDPEILFYEDGLTATISVERQEETTTLRANGKPEASDGADMATQIMVGLLPLVLRSAFDDVDPGGEEVAMIGYGSGVTAGASLQWPLEQLDVVELEPAMVDASRHFDHVNHRPLEDDRLNLIESDGRNYIEYSPATFDIIISEPSNPWIAGVSSLFTVEFFQRARAQLNPNGVFAQWVQLYEMHPDNVRTVFETFQSAFPHVLAFSSKPKSTDVILVGSQRKLPLPAQGFADAWAISSVQSELARVGHRSPHDLLGLLFMNQDQLREFSANAPLNTDDNGYLEFNAPRDVWFYEEGQQFFARWYFHKPHYGDPRPDLHQWPDGPQWTAERRGALAKSLWIAGKAETAAEVAKISDRAESSAASAPTLAATRSVLAIAEQPKMPTVRQWWPAAQRPQFSDLLAQLDDQDSRRQIRRQLEARAADPDELFDGSIALFYLALLVLDDDHRQALEQAQHLEKTMGDVPLFQYLLARANQGRRHYPAAFDAYLSAHELRSDRGHSSTTPGAP